MKRVLVPFFALLCAVAPLRAVEPDGCSGYQQLGTLYEIRGLMLRQKMLRETLPRLN